MDIKPTVWVVEDEPLICRSLARLFESAELECKCYSTASDFMAAFNPDRPACIIVDIQLPGMSGLELQEKLIECGCNHPVIVLTAHAEVPLAVRAMKHGAVDFIQKPFSEQILLDSVWRAINAHMQVWRSAQCAQAVKDRLNRLTPREREVLDLVVGGKPTRQIALMLGLSHKTIDNHRANILEKMGASGVVDLVRFVFQADLNHNKPGRMPKVSQC